MDNTIIPFTMEIKQYHDDGTYVVEYRPKDNTTYRNIELALCISLEDTEAHTEEHILARLAGCSPQHFWRQEELSKTFDDTLRKSVVGTIHDDAHLIIMPNNTQFSSGETFSPSTTHSSLTPEQLEELKIIALIQRTLSEMMGSTI